MFASTGADDSKRLQLAGALPSGAHSTPIRHSALSNADNRGVATVCLIVTKLDNSTL